MERDEIMKDYYQKMTTALKMNIMADNDEMTLFKLCLRGQSPVDMHYYLFTPYIELMGTEEQKAKWLPLCKKLKIHGCYAQTELGHGSNVAGLETTATFDEKTDEIVLNTPSITAYKFWPGELGILANHALVFARLISKGKDFGV